MEKIYTDYKQRTWKNLGHSFQDAQAMKELFKPFLTLITSSSFSTSTTPSKQNSTSRRLFTSSRNVTCFWVHCWCSKHWSMIASLLLVSPTMGNASCTRSVKAWTSCANSWLFDELTSFSDNSFSLRRAWSWSSILEASTCINKRCKGNVKTRPYLSRGLL